MICSSGQGNQQAGSLGCEITLPDFDGAVDRFDIVMLFVHIAGADDQKDQKGKHADSNLQGAVGTVGWFGSFRW